MTDNERILVLEKEVSELKKKIGVLETYNMRSAGENFLRSIFSEKYDQERSKNLMGGLNNEIFT